MPSLRITDLDGNLVFESDLMGFWSLEQGSDEDGQHIHFDELVKIPGDSDPEMTTEIIEYAINEGNGGRAHTQEAFFIATDECGDAVFSWDDLEALQALRFTYNPSADI